jgi:hypothetical protein
MRLENRTGAIGGQMAHVNDAMTGKQKEHSMNAQLKPASIIRTIKEGTPKRFAQRSLIGATLVVLLVVAFTLSQSLAYHSPTAKGHSGPTVQEFKFREVNSEWLPNAVDADVVAPVTPISQRQFLEVNTQLGMSEAPAIPAYPYGEAVTPVRGPR